MNDLINSINDPKHRIYQFSQLQEDNNSTFGMAQADLVGEERAYKQSFDDISVSGDFDHNHKEDHDLDLLGMETMETENTYGQRDERINFREEHMSKFLKMPRWFQRGSFFGGYGMSLKNPADDSGLITEEDNLNGFFINYNAESKSTRSDNVPLRVLGRQDSGDLMEVRRPQTATKQSKKKGQPQDWSKENLQKSLWNDESPSLKIILNKNDLKVSLNKPEKEEKKTEVRGKGQGKGVVKIDPQFDPKLLGKRKQVNNTKNLGIGAPVKRKKVSTPRAAKRKRRRTQPSSSARQKSRKNNMRENEHLHIVQKASKVKKFWDSTPKPSIPNIFKMITSTVRDEEVYIMEVVDLSKKELPINNIMTTNSDNGANANKSQASPINSRKMSLQIKSSGFIQK